MQHWKPFWAVVVLLGAMPVMNQTQAGAGDPVLGLDQAGLAEILAEHRGRTVLVNFWATWCSPCLKEIPELVRLQDTYPEDLVVFGVALDEPGMSAGSVAEFRDRYFPEFLTYRSLEPAMDNLVGVIDPAWNEIMPTSYVLAPDGRVIETLFGGKSYEVFETAVLEVINHGE